MKKPTVVFLFALMSLSLIGIIVVQYLWITSSIDYRKDQLEVTIKQSLEDVSQEAERMELERFMVAFNHLRDSLKLSSSPDKQDQLLVQPDWSAGDSTALSSGLPTGFALNPNLKINNAEFINLLNKKMQVIARDSSYLEGRNELGILRSLVASPKLQQLMSQFFRKYASKMPLKDRIKEKDVKRLILHQLEIRDLPTEFEFAVFDNDGITNIHSEQFRIDDKTYMYPFLETGAQDSDNKYTIVISGLPVKKILFSSVLGLAMMSLIFTLIIIATYLNAIFQIYRQDEISNIKTDFINNMTHEFKTPIATINLALDALSHDSIRNDREKNNVYLKMIRDENKRMFQQVENVLQISRLDKNTLNIERERLSVSEIIEESVSHVQLVLEEANGEILLHLGALRDEILGSESHMTNVIVNILENAIKYTKVDEPPVIDVYTENIRNRIVIKIRDQGVGMSKVAQKKVFDKFFREPTGDVHNVKGHGLGLAYAKRIIEYHEGTIQVKSMKGRGSTVVINLPLIN